MSSIQVLIELGSAIIASTSLSCICRYLYHNNIIFFGADDAIFDFIFMLV